MADDNLRQLFEQFKQIPVDVPPADQAIARGRRWRRGRLQASAIAWTVALAAGFGAPQAAGSLAAGAGSPGDGTLGTITRSAGTAALAPTQTPTPAHGPARIGTGTDSTPPVVPRRSPAPSRASSSGITYGPSNPGTSPFRIALTVAPPGDGALLLGLDGADRFVMARLGSASAPVPLPGLTAFAAAPPVLVTNPAGGWLVAVSGHSDRGSRTSRLAVVTTSGQSEPFGPKFARQSVASAAVNPDGTRVAIALTRPSGPVLLEILPLPGHSGATRSWQVPLMTLVTALSWAPDGRHLSYLATEQTAAGIAGGPVTLDTASRKATAPTASAWPSAASTGAACVPDAVAWLGGSGGFAALEACRASGTEVLQPADPRTGAPAGLPVVVAKRVGCGRPALDPDVTGGGVLISYCGIYLDDHGKLTRAPRRLTAAALSG
jgi:hypothetical protein